MCNKLSETGFTQSQFLKMEKKTKVQSCELGPFSQEGKKIGKKRIKKKNTPKQSRWIELCTPDWLCIYLSMYVCACLPEKRRATFPHTCDKPSAVRAFVHIYLRMCTKSQSFLPPPPPTQAQQQQQQPAHQQSQYCSPWPAGHHNTWPNELFPMVSPEDTLDLFVVSFWVIFQQVCDKTKDDCFVLGWSKFLKIRDGTSFFSFFFFLSLF